VSDNGYCKVRLVYNAGGKEGDEVERCEGWVRTRNISRIERKAGLPELKFLAQMAIDALKQNEEKRLQLIKENNYELKHKIGDIVKHYEW
jgi:hypothetical protein